MQMSHAIINAYRFAVQWSEARPNSHHIYTYTHTPYREMHATVIIYTNVCGFWLATSANPLTPPQPLPTYLRFFTSCDSSIKVMQQTPSDDTLCGRSVGSLAKGCWRRGWGRWRCVSGWLKNFCLVDAENEICYSVSLPILCRLLWTTSQGAKTFWDATKLFSYIHMYMRLFSLQKLPSMIFSSLMPYIAEN